MHSQSKFRAYTNYYITEYKASSVSINLNRYNFFVLYTKFLSVFRSSMNVTFCCDNALFQLNLAARSYQLTGTTSSDITGLTNRSCNSKSTCICQGDLYLACGTNRSKNGTGQLFLPSNDG